jgi:hypothetical protein
MQKKNSKTFLGAPAQSEDAHREALRMIEDDCLTDHATACNLSRSKKETRHAAIVSREDLFEPYSVHQ